VAKWLLMSIFGSIVLTVGLNGLTRWLPKSTRFLRSGAADRRAALDAGSERGTRFYFSWKLFIIGSIVLTILINLINLI
jgi:hypothetical protein